MDGRMDTRREGRFVVQMNQESEVNGDLGFSDFARGRREDLFLEVGPLNG